MQEDIRRPYHEKYLLEEIHRLREELTAEDRYPPIRDSAEGGPEDYYDDDYLSADVGLPLLEAELAKDPSDVGARFVALSEFYPPGPYPLYSPEVNQRVRAKYLKRLTYLVRLLPVELCNDWRMIRWEIFNSYAISDWDRAVALYDRAEELGLLERARLQAMRGQFRYLVVHGAELQRLLETNREKLNLWCRYSFGFNLMSPVETRFRYQNM